MRCTFTFIFFLFFTLHWSGSYAQKDTATSLSRQIELNKASFEDLLKRETQELQSLKDDRHTYYLIPEELPAWFFNPSEYAGTDRYMIGISDPGMDSARALQSAVIRAKALMIMAEGSEIENVSDNYLVTRETSEEFSRGSQFLDFTRIRAVDTLQLCNFNMDSCFYTKYGEAVVLTSYKGNSGDALDTVEIKSELMQLAKEDNILLEKVFLSKLDVRFYNSFRDSVHQDMHYEYKSENSLFDIVSMLGQDTIPFPAHPYRYLPSGTSVDSVDSLRTDRFTLRKGLWNAYINTILSEINIYNKYLKSKVKTSYDSYNVKDQGIVRTVSKNTSAFQLQGLRIKDQKLLLELQFHNLE